MLNRIIKNKKLLILVIALISVVGVAIVLIKGCLTENSGGSETNVEEDANHIEEELYDGDGLDVVEQDEEQEDNTSVDGSWEKETEKKPSGESAGNDSKDNTNNANKENAENNNSNNNTSDNGNDNTGDKNDETDKSEDDVIVDDKSWGNIF